MANTNTYVSYAALGGWAKTTIKTKYILIMMEAQGPSCTGHDIHKYINLADFLKNVLEVSHRNALGNVRSKFSRTTTRAGVLLLVAAAAGEGAA